MTPPRFLADAATIAGDVVVLAGPEGRHATDVRRLRVGEQVTIGDGAGAVVSGIVSAVTRGVLTVEVRDRWLEPAPSPRLVVVQALAKGGRDEDAVEAMTEVGVDEIVGWQAERSIARWTERTLPKWTTTAREAAKQSRRAWVPAVAGPASIDDVCARLNAASLGVVLHEAAALPLAALELPAAGDVVLVVGPEGGISDAELASFEPAGARRCRLGASVLRSSTAGVAALSVLSAATRWR